MILNFYEKLGIFPFIKHLFLQSESYYHRMTLPVLTLFKILQNAPFCRYYLSKFNKLEWGDTHYMPGLVKRACSNAMQYADNLLWCNEEFIDKSAKLFNIDFKLIFRKFLISQLLYKKFFYYELCLQFAKENHGKEYVFRVIGNTLYNYEDHFQKTGKVIFIRTWSVIEFYLGCLSICLLAFFKKETKTYQKISFENNIHCFVSDIDQYECYKDLFGDNQNVRYITNETYKGFFHNEHFNKHSILIPTLSKEKFVEFKRLSWQYAILHFMHRKSLSSIGFNLFFLYNSISSGRFMAPEGNGNFFFVCEHHDFHKTIRNEFIRSEGSKTIFFSYLQGFALRFYPEEYFQNYDYLCSSGPLLEDHFLESGSMPYVLMKTGSYNVYRKNRARDGEGIKKLQSFRNGYTSITILCPGVCKPTYNTEVELMRLTQQLAQNENVRIFVRRKPFKPEKQYDGFYESFVEGYGSILLTDMKIPLLEFVEVTDIFITTYSTSACDVAVAGGKVFFVDFMENSERFLFWQKKIINGLLLSTENALVKINEWVNDNVDGSVRTNHKKVMEHFIKYIGYDYHDFESYKTNILKLLRENVFNDNPAFKDI